VSGGVLSARLGCASGAQRHPPAPPVPSPSSGCSEGTTGEEGLVVPPCQRLWPLADEPRTRAERAPGDGVCSCSTTGHAMWVLDPGWSNLELKPTAGERSPANVGIPSACPAPRGTGLHSPHVQHRAHPRSCRPPRAPRWDQISPPGRSPAQPAACAGDLPPLLTQLGDQRRLKSASGCIPPRLPTHTRFRGGSWGGSGGSGGVGAPDGTPLPPAAPLFSHL